MENEKIARNICRTFGLFKDGFSQRDQEWPALVSAIKKELDKKDAQVAKYLRAFEKIVSAGECFCIQETPVPCDFCIAKQALEEGK